MLAGSTQTILSPQHSSGALTTMGVPAGYPTGSKILTQASDTQILQADCLDSVPLVFGSTPN